MVMEQQQPLLNLRNDNKGVDMKRLTSSSSLDDVSDISDQLQALRSQEETPAYRCHNYFSPVSLTETTTSTLPQPSLANEEFRSAMCEWSYRMVDCCNIQREVVAIAFSYLDRYLCSKQQDKSSCSSNHGLEVRDYQLASMTALYMAVKIHESSAFHPKTLAELSHGEFCVAEIEEMERKIIHALDWKLCGPTPRAFLRCFVPLLLLPDSTIAGRILTHAQYQVERSVFDGSLLHRYPSEIAFAAIVLAIRAEQTNISTTSQRKLIRTMEQLSGWNMETIVKDSVASLWLSVGSGWIVGREEEEEEENPLHDDEKQTRRTKNQKHKNSTVSASSQRPPLHPNSPKSVTG